MDQQNHVCNCCGKMLDPSIGYLGVSFRIQFGYGSKMDGTQSRFSLCMTCLDELYSSLVAKCTIAPEEWE